ncbi:hypothetical protein [Aquibium oceanicum]|uniref:Uncharacterized protein n=1 Tax=Aquibium oceanicum TaxID=1670800 RepID=A0A1L3SXN2_9HYPH|nr:hypothetical protein [Aquibium oceanicum]APH74104.1 hypothetical protein BSQ44_24100 [Aquibium oceanicum]
MNNIDAAINAATTAAANVPQEAANLPAPAPQQNTAVGRPIGMDDAMAGAVVVDEWLKVSEHGLQIGSKKPLLEEIKAIIDMSDISYTEVVKYGQNPATYRKTTDRVMSQDGATWAQALSEARSVQSNARPYKSADVNIELAEDVKLKEETIEAGTVLGHSFSTTGFSALAKLVKAMRKAGDDPATDRIAVTIGYEEKNGNGNTWGILEFREWRVVA